MFHSMRIRIITAFIIVTAIPLILMASFVYHEMEKTMENDIREGTTKEMIQMDRAIVSRLNGLKEDCQYLATDPDIEKVDQVNTFYNNQGQVPITDNDSLYNRIYQELERYGQQHPETAYAYLGTEQGGFIGWPRRAEQRGLEPRQRPWYKPAIENQQETFLSEPYKTFDGSKFTVTASHFVRNQEGAVIGVVGIDVSLDQFTQTISDMKVGKNGYVFMLTKDGTIMAHPQREYLGHNIAQLASEENPSANSGGISWDFPEYQRLLNSKSTYFETMIDGKKCLVNMQTSSLKNWTLVTVVSMDEIAGKAKQISLLLAAGTLVLILLILPFITALSYRLTQRLNELIRHLKNISDGNFADHLPDKLLASHDEIGGVARAIDFMQKSRQQAEWELQASNEELTATYQQLAATEGELREQIDRLSIKTQELEQSEERYRLVAAGSEDAIWDWNIKGKTVTLLGQWADRFRFSHHFTDCDLFDPRVVSRIHPDDLVKRQKSLEEHLAGRAPEYICEYRMIIQDGEKAGEPLWVLGRGKALFDDDGTPTRMAGSITDITQKKMQSMKIQHLAYHDALTGLANRLSFLERLSAELSGQLGSGSGALLFIDIDNFKMINDSMGHAVGDQFLWQTANALQKVAQEQFVARLGGDEFVVIFSGETDRLVISEFAQRLLQVVGEVCVSAFDPLAVTLSIGIAFYPVDGNDTKSLLKNADIAMQCAKRRGKHRYEFYHSAMETDIIHKVRLEAGLRRAIKNNEFVLYYQPIIDAENQLIAFEALIRWNSPEFGFMSPAQFIPIAEESDLIVEIGEWVLKNACLFGKKIHEAGLKEVGMSVNVSVREWLADDFMDKVTGMLAKTAFPADSLILEIVETVLIENFQKVSDKVYSLRKAGIKVSLDDFGIGYSSLTYLSKLPVNTIKIDKSFVDDLLNKNNYAAIVGTIIQLAHEMGFDVVAEGVETADQFEFLKKLKCDRMQGYLIGRPMPEQEVMEKYHNE